MVKIRIVSNPYEREIKYFVFDEKEGLWKLIQDASPESKLREDENHRTFLPFKIKEIIDIVINEYYVGKDKIAIFFEGTQDEYDEVLKVCSEACISDKIELTKNERFLENARDILKSTKECFGKVHPIIEKIVKDDAKVTSNLVKVSDALDDIIPICVFGNYSAGKSTFINALIGSEVLTCGGTVVTAKIYRIERSSQDDRARIRFTFKNSPVELFFENTNFRVLQGENELINQINSAISESENVDMFNYVKIALDLINGYEKTDKEEYEIGNVIQIEIPFSKNGILGQSLNNYVIFDTPGSNSNSNTEHSHVLAEALDGFSNGIPVWVSTFDNLDTKDNAELCHKILEIEALDKRFTMIICNRADQADLEGEELPESQEKEILEYHSVEDMYASGVFFVSSIMGLGSKNAGEFSDKYYKKTYKKQIDSYDDPEDEFYTSLYKFNIMPKQIKQHALEYASEAPNLVYANSGLYCVEREMETFASRHSAYNKCQMVYTFLDRVVEETNTRIESRTNSLIKRRELRKEELESAKAELLDTLAKSISENEREFERSSKVRVKELAAVKDAYEHSVEEMKRRTEKVHQENADETDLDKQEKEYEEARTSMWTHMKENGQNFFKGNVIDSFKAMSSDFRKDFKEVQEGYEAVQNVNRAIDKTTSDRVLHAVQVEYRKNTLAANEVLGEALKEYWKDNESKLRSALTEIIAGTDALTSSQREEMASIIMSYEGLEFDDQADLIFVKTRFLRGALFGIEIIGSEKIDIRRLTDKYNETMKRNVKEIAQKLNENCFNSFTNWAQKLSAVIEQNITEYNPQLRDMAELIKEETEKIAELENDQYVINNSLEAIKTLMSWKVAE